MPVTAKCPWWLRTCEGGLYYEVDKALAAEVQLTFIDYLNGFSTKQIAARRNFAGWPPVLDEQRRSWTERSVTQLLRNRAVAGVRVVHQKADPSKQVVELDYFPQVVAAEDFDEVQRLLDDSKTQGGRNANGSNLFRGICVCACGKPVHAFDAARVRPPPDDGWAAGELRCSDRTCRASTPIPLHMLEASFLNVVMGIGSYDLDAAQGLLPTKPYHGRERAELLKLAEELPEVRIEQLRHRLAAIVDAVESARRPELQAEPSDAPWKQNRADQLKDLVFELWDKAKPHERSEREAIRARLQRRIRQLMTHVVLRKARQADYPPNTSDWGLCEVQWSLGAELQRVAAGRTPSFLHNASRIELRMWTEPLGPDSSQGQTTRLTKVRIKQM